ncbi:MAG: nitroreductase family deazaflavin-dependent oxidoreductase [Acidimicrobiales bacterium]
MPPKTPNRPGPLVRRLLRAPTALYHHDLGWLLGRRFMMLTHVGRRSGKQYHTVLEVIAFDESLREVVVVAGLGPSTDWYRNIQASPPIQVRIGRDRFQPVVRHLDEDEAIGMLADYERRNRWAAPVVRRVLTWLVGWPYDASDGARRRLVKQLPLVAFTPAPPCD